MLGQHSVNRWELRSCARKGHITYAPDDAALAELMFGWTREVITDWLPHDKPYLDDGLICSPVSEMNWSPRTRCCAGSAGTATISRSPNSPEKWPESCRGVEFRSITA